MDFQKVANEILDGIGGKENIKAIEHCATRLRIVVNDDNLVNKDAIKSIKGIGGYFLQSGQHQIIVGTGKVNKVFECITNGGEIKVGGAKDEAYSNLNPFQKLLRTLADVFIPLIPVLVATGLCMGLRGFAQQLGVEFSPEFLTLTQVVTDTVFIFLPALVVWSAFKRLGGTPVIGMVLGLMLVAPMLPNAYAVGSRDIEPIRIGIFAIKGFQGTIIPALIVGITGAFVEKKVRSIVPSVMDLVLTPFLTLVIGIVLALFVIGPVFTQVEHSAISVIKRIIELPFGIGGAIYGGLQQVLVVTGLHHSLITIETAYLNAIGLDPLNALGTASMAGQAGAAIAYTLSIRDKEERALKFSSIVPCFFGITEPLLFGITLQNTRVFVAGIIGGAVAGAFAAILQIAPPVLGVTFIPAIPAYIGYRLELYLAMILIGILAGMLMTKILVKGEKK